MPKLVYTIISLVFIHPIAGPRNSAVAVSILLASSNMTPKGYVLGPKFLLASGSVPKRHQYQP